MLTPSTLCTYRAVFLCGDEQLTYAQLEEEANRFVHYLIESGSE